MVSDYLFRMADVEYGGCEGPEAEYVKLISSDQHEFIIKKEHALTSGTIKVSKSIDALLYNVLCLGYVVGTWTIF